MPLVARLDAGLRGFEPALRDHRPLTATLAIHVDAQWPDYRAAIAALEAQQLTLRRTGAMAQVVIAEEANTDAFIRTLIDLAESLHTSPADLRQLGISRPEPATVALPGFDPNAARYAALGGPRFSYVGVQIVVAFAIVALAEQAHTDVQPPLWRVYGTLLGTAALFLAFRLVAPDYAGRQLVARFTGIVREMLRLLARPGSVSLTVAEAMAVRQRIFATLPDILRLADEAHAEAFTGGVDTQAAIVAGGRGVRIGSRLAAICRERVANPLPPLSNAMQTAVTNAETAVRAWLEIAVSMLEARPPVAPPGSPGAAQQRAA